MIIRVKKIDLRGKIPIKHNKSDAAFDIYAIEDVDIGSKETKILHTGICMEIPLGYYGQILSRSSTASKGVFTTGGVIDSGYRGEIMVILNNLGSVHKIKQGDRIAQITFHKLEEFEFSEVPDLDMTNNRGGGFGSSNS